MTLSKKFQGNFRITLGAIMMGGPVLAIFGILIYSGMGLLEFEWWAWPLGIGLLLVVVKGGSLINSGSELRKEFDKNEGRIQ